MDGHVAISQVKKGLIIFTFLLNIENGEKIRLCDAY